MFKCNVCGHDHAEQPHACVKCGGYNFTTVAHDPYEGFGPAKTPAKRPTLSGLPPCSAGRQTPEQVAARNAKVQARGMTLTNAERLTLLQLAVRPTLKKELMEMGKGRGRAVTMGAATREGNGCQGGGLLGRGMVTAQATSGGILYTITDLGREALNPEAAAA